MRCFRRNPVLDDVTTLAVLGALVVGGIFVYRLFNKAPTPTTPTGINESNPLNITNPELYAYDPIGWAEQMQTSGQQLTPQDAMLLQQLGMGTVPGQTTLGTMGQLDNWSNPLLYRNVI